MLEDIAALGGLVFEDDFDALVEVAGYLEAFADDGRLEFDLRKDRRVGVKKNRGAGAARGSQLLERSNRLALLEPHLPLRAVAPDGRDQILRERVDDAGPDAMQATSGLVAAVFEFSAGVQHREDHLERAFLRGRVLVHRDAAPVVLDRD